MLLLIMNQDIIQSKIAELEESIEDINSPSEAVNKIYSLILLKKTVNAENEIYKLSKLFIVNYVEVIKNSDYGYDTFNYEKVEKILNCLNYKSQISILLFIISNMTKELPEYDKDWFICKKNSVQIKDILQNFKVKNVFKLISLFSGLNILTLFSTLLIVFFFTSIILLPSPLNFCEIFEIKYENYSSDFITNHLLNILTLFADLDNDFKVKPLNGVAILMMLFSKIIFIILIVNFVYVKITEKINE